MGKVIRIDDDVYESLQKLAAELNEPFTSPNNILRFILELNENETLPEQLVKQVKKS